MSDREMEEQGISDKEIMNLCRLAGGTVYEAMHLGSQEAREAMKVFINKLVSSPQPEISDVPPPAKK